MRASGLRPDRFGLRCGGDDQRRGAVVDAGRVAGGHGAVFLERRLQRRPAWPRSSRRADTRRDRRGADRLSSAARRPERSPSANAPLSIAACRAPLAFGGERVLVGARYVVAARDFFGGDAHVAGVDRAGQPFAQHRVDDLGVAHAVAPARALQQVRRVRHRLGAARDDRVDVADANRFDGVDDSLQPGPADAIDGFAGHLDRQAGLERRLARDVHARARLQHAAHDARRRHRRASRRARAIASRITTAPRSTALTSFSAPPNDPIGVRHALENDDLEVFVHKRPRLAPSWAR